jgi:uncharacterized protein YcbX
MIRVGTVAALWRYPVSSAAGERLDACTIGPRGVVGDRRFGLVDMATGAPARPEQDVRWHRALAVDAMLDAGGETLVRVPGSDWLPALSAELEPLLKAHFGFACAIRPYENRTPPEAYTGRWAVNRYEPNALHLLTTASQARLRRLHPGGDLDARRFRPNVLVAMDEVEGAFPEAGWIGRRIRIGDLELAVERQTRRCGFTIIPQEGLAQDADILRHLVRSNGHNMGVYCLPQATATVRLGDAVSLVE